MSRILVIDDEPKMTTLIAATLRESGHTVETADSGRGAMERLKQEPFDLVISDIRLPVPDGMAILAWTRQHRPDTEVIMMTAYGEVKAAVTALKMGAADYLIKPFSLDELTLLVNRLLQQRRRDHLSDLREHDFHRLAYDDFVGQALATRTLIELIRKVAATDTTVLITGESGSGKELAARMVHEESGRKAGPFIPVNCAALTETLLESELFGHEKGAFTGAVARKPGRFELADGGSIFLDEIGEMSPGLQSKLLRVLEERRLTRVGGVDNIAIDVRLITATNRNLKELVREGRFREDLYFRINVFPVTMPPLRERKEDIPHLARYFLRRKNYPHPDLDPEVLKLLCDYSWPGNIRELKNILERAMILSGGEPIDPGSVGIDDDELPVTADDTVKAVSLGEKEKAMIIDALATSGNNKTDAARLLGITRRRLYSRMKIHGLKP
jgi:two-component system NtrC family response regulator